MQEETNLLRMSNYERHGQLPGSLELAYLGDTIYDLYVRARLVAVGGSVNKLHKSAVQCVCAHAQADALNRIEHELTTQEMDVVRRGRNAKQSPAKNADRAEYHQATGLEALIGYLYVTGQMERLDEIVNHALDVRQSGGA